MKVLKKATYFLAAILAIVLITALFVPKEYAMEREVEINKPNSEVFDYIKYVKNQDNFSAWAKLDPDTKKEYTGTDGEVGFISSWESDNKEVGKGAQEIVKIEEGKRVDFELRFIEPFKATDYAYFATESIDSITTTVKWGFDGEIAYPMNIMLLWMDMEEMLAPDLEEGLQNLKALLEKE